MWKPAEKAKDSADALAMTSARLKELDLVDRIVPEPLGGAHRDPEGIAAALKAVILEELAALDQLSPEQLLEQRYRRLRRYGVPAAD